MTPTRHPRARAAAALCATLALGAAVPPAHAQGNVRYTVTPLVVPGASNVGAVALNDDGLVGGTAFVGGQARGFFWQDGSAVISHPIGALGSGIRAIDAVGVGYGSSTWAGGVERASRFIVLGAVADPLPPDVASTSYVAVDPSGMWKAARWQRTSGTVLVQLQFQNGPWTPINLDQAFGVNASGTVVGSEFNQAATWRAGQLTLLEAAPGASTSIGFAINASGTVAGRAGNQAARWDGGRLTLLAPLPESVVATAVALNDRGVLVGVSDGGSIGATLWAPGRDAVRLDRFVTGPTHGLDAQRAQAINARGQVIVTDGSVRNSWLLTPTGTLRWAGGDGRLGDSQRWDSPLGFTPIPLLDVVVASPGRARVTADEAAAMKSLRVGEASGVGVVTLALERGVTLSSASPVLVEATGALAGNGRIDAGVLNRGSVIGTAAEPLALAFTGELDNRGLVAGSGRIDATLVNRGSASGVRVGAGESLHFASTVHTNADGGRIEVRGGGELRFTGNLTNQGGAFVRLDDATLRLDNGMVNGGVVQIGFGGASVFGEVVNNPAVDLNRGRIIASGAADVTFWDRVVNQGEIRASAGSRILYFGPVSGAGSFTTNGGGYHRFEGGFSAGTAAASTRFGAVEFASRLSLRLEGSGPAAGGGPLLGFGDRVRFDDGSVLELLAADGLGFTEGQRWQLFGYALAPEGGFDALALPTLPGSLFWDTSDLYAGGSVAVVPEPASALLMLAGTAWLLRRRWHGGAAGGTPAHMNRCSPAFSPPRIT